MNKLVVKCMVVSLLPLLNIAAVRAPENSEEISWQIRQPVEIPLQYMLIEANEGEELLNEPVTETDNQVYRLQKFPGYVDGLQGDYTLTAKIVPDGEWDAECFEISILRSALAIADRTFVVKVLATNDGQFVSGKISATFPKSSTDVQINTSPEFCFEFLWLQIKRQGDKLSVYYTTSEDPKDYLTLLSVEVAGKDCVDWPMYLSGESDGLCLEAADSSLKL